MHQDRHVIEPDKAYRHVFILESREWWPVDGFSYDPVQDLVLTYDFALKRDIEALGGHVQYVDHLCEQAVMQENNFRMYQFFRSWHYDAEGADIFRYRGVDFGFSFRIEIWNDFTFYVRSRLCMEQMKRLKHERLFVGAGHSLLEDVLYDAGFADFTRLRNSPSPASIGYYFPVYRWMDERLRIRRMRHVIRDVVTTVQGVAMSWFDRITGLFHPTPRIFVQEYHPTRQLLQCLQRQPGISITLGHFSAAQGLMKFIRERPIPIYGGLERFRSTASRLINVFRQRRTARLVLSNGVDVTDAVYRIIEGRVVEILPKSLRALDCVIGYLDRHPIKLEILIANLGQVASLVDCVAKSRGVPSYMIINGLLLNDFLDEAKYATIINSYSLSIRDHYFRGMDNVICIGDPRMDDYAKTQPRQINRHVPTITIGASGFNSLDLNSYLAVEFEFLHDVLTVIRSLPGRVQQFRVVLKVRANGYIELYRHFVAEYFPDVLVDIVDNVPMYTVLTDTDFYISGSSQTLFEASCLGIPVVYHKKDGEIINPPFDGDSELVTTYDVVGLTKAVTDFLSGSKRFDAFMQRNVMEKYVGPLDGCNLKRNLDFVNELLSKYSPGSPV